MRLSYRSKSSCHDQEWNELSWYCLIKESIFKIMIKWECKKKSRIILIYISMWFQWIFNDDDMDNWLNEEWELLSSFVVYDNNSWDCNIRKIDLGMRMSIGISTFFI